MINTRSTVLLARMRFVCSQNCCVFLPDVSWNARLEFRNVTTYFDSYRHLHLCNDLDCAVLSDFGESPRQRNLHPRRVGTPCHQGSIYFGWKVFRDSYFFQPFLATRWHVFCLPFGFGLLRIVRYLEQQCLRPSYAGWVELGFSPFCRKVSPPSSRCSCLRWTIGRNFPLLSTTEHRQRGKCVLQRLFVCAVLLFRYQFNIGRSALIRFFGRKLCTASTSFHWVADSPISTIKMLSFSNFYRSSRVYAVK